MKEFLDYNPRLLAWTLHYRDGDLTYAPASFTFEDKPSDTVLRNCREIAEAAFERKKSST